MQPPSRPRDGASTLLFLRDWDGNYDPDEGMDEAADLAEAVRTLAAAVAEPQAAR